MFISIGQAIETCAPRSWATFQAKSDMPVMCMNRLSPPVPPPNQWPPYPNGTLPAPLTTRDVLRYATINGAKALGLDKKVGTLTPYKEADIIILDATRINVAPLNQVPGAVVSLMDRTNVETVIVAGKVRKWKGQLLDNITGAPLNLGVLRAQLEASRDYLFQQYINNPFVGNPVTGNPPIRPLMPVSIRRFRRGGPAPRPAAVAATRRSSGFDRRQDIPWPCVAR